MPEPSVVKSVRLPRELTDRLTARAELEHRTVNNLITKILAEALDTSAGLGFDTPAPEDKDNPA